MPFAQRFRLGWADLTMVVGGLATILWWSTGPSLAQFGVQAMLWIAAWIWWLTRRPLRLWGPVAAIAVFVVLGGDGLTPQWAFQIERGCFEERAVQLLETDVPSEPFGFEQVAPSGRCRLLSYESVEIVNIRYPRDFEQSSIPAVVFRGAGSPKPDIGFTDRGFVFSPSGEPQRCQLFVRGTSLNDCDVVPLGGDWYWFEESHTLN